MSKFSREEGVTLIVLALTVIVALIIMAVSYQTLMGRNGLVSRSKTTANDYVESEAIEENAIENTHSTYQNIITDERWSD